jgi:hypothetical protein
MSDGNLSSFIEILKSLIRIIIILKAYAFCKKNNFIDKKGNLWIDHLCINYNFHNSQLIDNKSNFDKF